MWYGRHTVGASETPGSGFPAAPGADQPSPARRACAITVGIPTVALPGPFGERGLGAYGMAGCNGRGHGSQIVCPCAGQLASQG
jgi:hypothetical protein